MKKRRLSILLSIVMLLSLLPTTALAADTYPTATAVSVDGNKSFSEGHYYFKNGDHVGNFSGEADNYNAYYNPNTGVLTLQNYNGGSITVGGNKESKITVVLVGDNFINDGNLNSPYGGDITVTSGSSGGTLSITQTIDDSNNAAIGIKAGYGNYETGNVTIMGDANVTINMTHNGTSTCERAYGIYAKKNITISDNASVYITCATPENTTGGDHCNGLRADENVIIDTTGTININVTNAGKDENNGYSYGVYPMGTATLTKVGNMEVQWKKAGNNINSSGGAFFRSASFSDTPYAINVDETNCYASYRHGTPRTVTVENGTLTGPGVPNASGSGSFLQGDKVNITPDTKKSWDDQEIPFKEWTSSDVTLDESATTASNSFTVPVKDVTVTAKHSPFVGTPTFTPTDSTGAEGTLTFTTKVKADETYEGFRLVKEAEVDDPTKYKSINPSTTSPSSPYEYSYKTSRLSGVNKVDEGNYYVVAYLNNHYYLGEKVTVNYTAAPAGNYPDHVRMFNENGDTTSLGDGECLTANDATGASSYTGGSSYVARYDKSSGTLYLNGYHGAATHNMIFSIGDLNIEVVSDSSFTTSTTTTNNLSGIQAEGKLTISGSGKLTVTANGNGNVYGIYAKEGVTISAPLDVNVGKVDSSQNGPVHGIYTQSGAISLSGGDKTITATVAKENVYGVYNAAETPAITGNGNITISGELTVNLSNGFNNRGISSQGGVITLDGAIVRIPGSYYYGIYNGNGNVDIKSNSDVDISSVISNNNGICTDTGGDLTIEDSTVKVSAKGYVANLKNGKLSIENSDVELTKTSDTTALVVNTSSSATNTIDLSGRGSVTLTALGNQAGTMIGGKVSITSGTKLETGHDYSEHYQNYDGKYDEASDKTVLQFMSTAPTATVDAVTIGGTTGTEIAATDVTITLTNDKFKAITADSDVSSWFTNLPAGLDAKIKTDVSANATTATVEISGTPTATGSDALAITIPAANLVSNTALTVTNNPSAVFAITAPATPIAAPTANTGLVYDGTEKTGVTESAGYTLTGTYKAIDVGTADYTATATLNPGFKWNDDSTGDKTITWNIGKKTPTATDFTFAPPTDLTYDGNNKTASFTLTSPLTKSGAITPTYMKGGSVVAETKDVGTYTVKIDVAAGDNFNVGSGLTDTAWTFAITPAEWGTPTETLTPVNPTTTGGNNGQITGTTNAMQYKKATESSWNNCAGDVTGLTAGTYYVRYKADSNHTASDTNYKTVTLTDPGTTLYGVTVTNGTAVPTGDQAAGAEVTITATTKTGFNFKEWTGLADGVYKSGSTKTSNPATFIMPASNVSVKATFTPAALIGTASITGNLKYDEELTASLAGGNNTGTLTYTWYRSGETTAIATNNTGKYTLTADDIGKTITVKISSDVQTGEITSSATGTIAKADGPAAPVGLTGVAPTTSGGADGKIKNTDTTLEYSKTTYFAPKYDCSASETTGLTAGTYYVRAKETSTHNAGAYATVNVPAYTGGGGGSSSGGGGAAPATPQKPEIKPVTGGKVSLSADGTTATITPDAGKVVDKVLVNGKDMGAVTELKGLKTGDKIEVLFKDEVKEPSKAETDKQVKANMQKLAPKARSLKTKAGNVKVSFEGQFKDIEALGYTVKYKFYRSTKKASGYKHMLTTSKPSYTNTYGKKGTMYYYKARVMIYDKEGNFVAQTALKQCKYASRLWTK